MYVCVRVCVCVEGVRVCMRIDRYIYIYNLQLNIKVCKFKTSHKVYLFRL